MIEASDVALSIPVAPLFRRHIAFDSVHLGRATIVLERADDRKNWLLDRTQRDESARISVRNLTFDEGRIEFVDPARNTGIDLQVVTRGPSSAYHQTSLAFNVRGRYMGEPLAAAGSGDGMLTLRDAHHPYHLKVIGRVGPTGISAEGDVTNLLQLSAVDLRISLQGGNLGELHPLLGVALPDTPPYSIAGRLTHSDRIWRYQHFAGQIGSSDIAGTLQIATDDERPLMTAALRSRRLRLADLGPLVGIGEPVAARAAGWKGMDADVVVKAQSIERPDALSIDRLATRLRLHNGVMVLDPLEFAVAGEILEGKIMLDASRTPFSATTMLRPRNFGRTRMPRPELTRTSVDARQESGKRTNRVAAQMCVV